MARSWARGRLRGHGEDLEQEAALACLLAIAAGKVMDETFAAVVAWRRCRDYARWAKSRAMPAAVGEPAASGVPPALDAADEWAAVARRLTPRDRAVLFAWCGEGRSLTAAGAAICRAVSRLAPIAAPAVGTLRATAWH